jgi:hypothetical protein
MQTPTKAFQVRVKMSSILHFLNELKIDMSYEGIILATSKQDCLEQLIKKIDEIFKDAVQKKIQPSLLELQINELGTFNYGELLTEIIFNWRKDLGYLPYLDPYQLMEFLVSAHEEFLTQHGIFPVYHDDLPFKN